MTFADLHIHTHYSDSTLTPEDIVREAQVNGIRAVGIADHDTVDGVRPVEVAATPKGIEVVPAIELSSELNDQDIHVLGYFIDIGNAAFKAKLQEIQEIRIERIEKMIAKLKTLGIDNITPQEVCSLAESDSVGRPHLAMTLEKKGWVSDVKEAFDKYLSEDAPAYVKKYKQTPEEAIALIRSCGGVAVLAHPMITGRDEIIPGLVKAGLQGLEAYYPNCPSAVIDFYVGLARKYSLVATGGSDAHGLGKTNTFIGKMKVPYEVVEELKTRARK